MLVVNCSDAYPFRRKPQTKKHKTWDGAYLITVDAVMHNTSDLYSLGDGVLVVNDTSVELQNLDRQRCVELPQIQCCFIERVARIIYARNGATSIRPGEVLNLGGKEICIDHGITPADFFSGACFDIEPDFDLPPPRTRTPLAVASPAPNSSSFKPLVPKVPMRLAVSSTAGLVQRPQQTDHARKQSAEGEKTRYWTAQWRKPQTKKNKSWDGDGFVSQCGNKVVFMDEDCVP